MYCGIATNRRNGTNPKLGHINSQEIIALMPEMRVWKNS